MRRRLLALCLGGLVPAPNAAEPPPPLTREQLAACLADEDALRTRAAALDGRRQALTATLADIQALETRLDADKATLDDTDAAAVSAFNAAIDEHARLANEYNGALPEINASIEALNETRREIDARCAQRAYDERDLEALRARRPENL